MSTYAADDGEAIRAGMEKLRAERDRIFRCVCEWRVGPKGQVLPVPVADCPLHSVRPIEWHTNFGDETEGLRIAQRENWRLIAEHVDRVRGETEERAA